MESSKANENQQQQHPRLTSQISIQPNIPQAMLGRSNSRRIVTQKAAPTFPTKTLRMKSLLWTKPTGIATSSFSSTIKQVKLYHLRYQPSVEMKKCVCDAMRQVAVIQIWN